MCVAAFLSGVNYFRFLIARYGKPAYLTSKYWQLSWQPYRGIFSTLWDNYNTGINGSISTEMPFFVCFCKQGDHYIERFLPNVSFLHPLKIKSKVSWRSQDGIEIEHWTKMSWNNTIFYLSFEILSSRVMMKTRSF